mmetsp:Transcript_69260/g.196253  ORF Transcript_69260/g.196253 Transcript_69260/m.196253 type:complete len:223 (+) Transcript_69260:468-1136(+)
MPGDHRVLDDNVVFLVLPDAHLGILCAKHSLCREQLVDRHGREPAQDGLHLAAPQQSPDLALAGAPVAVHLNPGEQPAGALQLLRRALQLDLGLFRDPLDVGARLLRQELPVLRGHEAVDQLLAHGHLPALLALLGHLREAHGLRVDLEPHVLEELVRACLGGSHLSGHVLLAEFQPRPLCQGPAIIIRPLGEHGSPPRLLRPLRHAEGGPAAGGVGLPVRP